ncbi:MAG: HD domain-containing protein [Bacilli bacterium]|nr:HD domain-containing protein [Bacilli bacterium]
MKITDEQKERLEAIYQSFFHDPRIQRMKEVKMHRGSNCFEHSFKVAKKAIRGALRSKRKNIDLEVVLIGAILHDYYLYDWREDRSKKKGHGRNHQYIASQNAVRDFDISPEVKKVIESHMWPLNLKDYPKSREAKIVSISDKAVALGESLTSIAYKNKKRQKYLDDISTLF